MWCFIFVYNACNIDFFDGLSGFCPKELFLPFSCLWTRLEVSPRQARALLLRTHVVHVVYYRLCYDSNLKIFDLPFQFDSCRLGLFEWGIYCRLHYFTVGLSRFGRAIFLSRYFCRSRRDVQSAPIPRSNDLVDHEITRI